MELDDAARRHVDRRARVGLLPYAVATAASALSPYLTLGICALLAVYYALPSTAYEQPTNQTRTHHDHPRQSTHEDQR